MAEELLDKVRDSLEGQIDFEGQKLAETLATLLLSVTTAVAFVVGFFFQDIKLAMYIGLAGTALTFIAVVPPWPPFNEHPVAWLEPGGATNVSTVENTS